MTMQAELWTAWKTRRDARAFEALVGPELGHALGFARRLGSSPADAEDAVQEALARLAAAKDDAPPELGIRAWLCREVRNRVRSGRRSERRIHAREAAHARPEGVAPGEPSLDVKEQVERALASLSEDDREAVTLRFLHDLDYAEVAATLGISEGASRSRVHRAVTALRERLGRDGASALALLPGLVEVDVARVVEASLARSAAAEGVVVMSASKKLVVATLLSGVLAAGAAVLLAGLGVLGARGSTGGDVAAVGGQGERRADAGGSAGDGDGSTARSRPRAARPPADDAASVKVTAALPLSTASATGAAAATDAVSEARDPKLQTKRDKYREKQESAGIRCYFDLTYGVGAGTAEKPSIDSRWTFSSHPADAKEESGIQLSAVFADERMADGGAITLRVQKFVHKAGKSEFSVPFEHAGVSPKTADAKGMIAGYFAEYAAVLKDVVKDRCVEPRKLRIGPAEYFASVVGTSPQTKQRERIDFYLWQGPNTTWVCTFTYTGVFERRSSDFEEKVDAIMRAHRELKAPD